ncbi:hypothetical protein [Candidatus Protochlamydia naegleriophila]|uniref:hypothetical protein n=1 Tax=Candidatus Protochlamydia naegleriophila TaxID=389348 RepID=UPI00073EE1C8|nr:hypothetical protein [Candidatus Protochlamydia naegleriophila]
MTLTKQIDASRAETEKNLGIETKLALYQKIAMDMLESNSREEATRIARTHPFTAISMGT